MNFIRPLIVCVAALFLTLPQESFAATKKVIVGFHRTPELHEQNIIHNSKGRIRRAHRLIPAITVEIPEEEIAQLKRDPSVAYVVDDVPVKQIQAIQTPTPLSAEYTDSWGIVKIGADISASRGFKGAGIKVAIIDSGIDYNHPELKDNYKGGYNFVADNTDPYDDDTISHGTHIAGIIAAKDNGTGVVGVAPEASLYAVKVFGANGAGGELSMIIAGIEWAIENKMNVVNLSGGIDATLAQMMPEVFKPLQDVCDLAYKNGIVLVAAAGNTGNGTVSIPAAYGSVIAVSAIDQNNQRAVFSRFESSSFGPEIELTAPGTDIKSTVKGGGYALLSGTSQAAPHVSGAAAAILSSGITDENGNGSVADEVRQRLAATAVDLGTPGRDTFFGWGLVDLAAATASVDKHLRLVRTTGRPFRDAVTLQLAAGTYKISVVNNGLQKITVKASEAHKLRSIARSGRDLEMRRSRNSSMEIQIEHTGGSMEFIPYGDKGASADITIKKLNNQVVQ